MGKPQLQDFVWDSPQERRWREGSRAAQHLQALRQACDAGQWPQAAQEADALVDSVRELAGIDPAGADAYWLEASTAIAALIDALHPLLVINSQQPLPEPERSELCWQLSALLDQLLTTPAPLPPRLAGMHTHLLLYGGIYWRRRHQEEGEGIERVRHLFGRACHRMNAIPDWLRQACDQLDITPIADPGPETAEPSVDAADAVEVEPGEGEQGVEPADDRDQPVAASATAEGAAQGSSGEPVCPPSRLWPPSQLSEELEQWLDDVGPNRALCIGLACVPGASMLCRDGPRLELNIAALLEDPSGVAPDPWLQALREPLQRRLSRGWMQQLELREPLSSLYESLGHLWRLGGGLPPRRLQRLPAVLDAWNRLLGPAQLQAQRLPGTLTLGQSRSAAAATLQVQLDPLELAALMACDPAGYASQQDADWAIEAALARLRREHHNATFWKAAAADPGVPGEPLEALRLLHCEAGFYACSGEGLSCVRRWREGSLACLERAQITGVEQGISAPALLLMAQRLTERSGRLPNLQPRQPLLELLESLGGREVVYVGWAWQAVLEQHRSGRAFRLFNDRSIVPYGLRSVAMPDSRHPHRPHGGFQDSLDRLIEALEREHAARPIDLLLVDQGAYRLPLLERIERQLSISAVAPGPGLPLLFGVDRPTTLPRWRDQQRNPESWRDLS
jgi:hypothetical protein